MVQGFHQQPKLDYTKTFSPVVKSVTVHLLLSLALSSNGPLHQLDMKNAFLHGDLADTVYMKQLLGFVNPDLLTFICKLCKSIYGLKRALMAWFVKLCDRLKSL